MAVRHLGFVGRVLGPPTMTWWFLSFSIVVQYFVFFGGGREISLPKWGTMSTKPPKGTPSCDSASFEPSSLEIRRRV